METIPESIIGNEVANEAGGASVVPQNEESIRPLEDVEREIIEHAIDLCGGNVPKAAARLGVSASTIYRKRTAWEQP